MRAQRVFIVVATLVAGCGSMVVELASVRALAPHFGASTEIWTSSIGVVLFALAAGYAAGGAAAEKGNVVRWLGLSLAIAGAITCISPFALPWIATKLLPADLSLSDALPILRAGAFITQCALFALPIFLLGLANPLLVKGLAFAPGSGGRAAGTVLAISTIGGLLGTFGTTYWFIPQFGVRATLFVCGLSFGALGTVLLAMDRSWKHASSVILLIAAAAVAASGSLDGPIKKAKNDEWLLAEVDGREQYLRVIEPKVNDPRRDPARERWLQVSECLDSFQSLDAPNRATPGHYYDVLAAAALFSGVDRDPRICIIGAGTGSVARSISEMIKNPLIDAVEIDPEIVKLGREYFRLGELEKFTTVHSGVDGRVALRYLPARGKVNLTESSPAESRPGGSLAFDAILIDAYARQVEIPYHLVTREMFALCKQKLNDGGILAINVSAFGPEDPVLRSIAATASSVFAANTTNPTNVAVLKVPWNHNAILVARKGSALPTASRFLQKIRMLGFEAAAAVAQSIAGPSGMELYQPSAGDFVLTDDRAPMEQLQALSLALAARTR